MTIRRDQDLQVLKEFIKGDRQVKAEHFDRMAEISTSFLTECKKVLETGSLEEKKAIMKKFKFFRFVMQKRYAKLKKELGLNDEQTQEAVIFFLKHSPEHREKISRVRAEMMGHKADLQKIARPAPKRKSKIRSKRAKWIQS